MQAGLREGTGAHGIEAVEKWLFKQLNEIAPGKYITAGVLQRLKHTQRNQFCTHLKGGRVKGPAWAKDYNFSVFTFADGITEIKCLYNCGLKLRSNTADQNDFRELLSITNDSTNTPASSESLRLVRGGIVLPVDPGPVPTYTDADRARVQERERLFWEWAKANPEEYRKQYGNVSYNHPDPKEAPKSIILRQMVNIMAKRPKLLPRTKLTQDTFEALRASHIAAKSAPKVVFQDEGVPALEPVKQNNKIRKARKTQSRRKTNKK